MLRLSQGHLSLLDTCPRKFQHILLDQLAAPHSPEQQERIAWGDRFHLLMQQQQLALPVEALLRGNPDLETTLQALRQSAPDLFLPSLDETAPTQVLSEHLRSFTLGGYSFSVIYDLLLTEPERAQIIDWKTYPQPQQVQWLQQHWQTRLYCYSLVETSDYLPEQVSMTYWFVRGSETETTPQSLAIAYSTAQHAQVATALAQRCEQLDHYLTTYRRGDELPQVSETLGRCDRCPFQERCQRGLSGADPGRFPSAWSDLDFSLETVEEVLP